MKQIIWSRENRLDDEARECYQNFQRESQNDDSYIVNDEEWANEVYGYLDDERQNLNNHIDGLSRCLHVCRFGTVVWPLSLFYVSFSIFIYTLCVYLQYY